MSNLKERARQLALKTMVEQFVNDMRDEDELTTLLMQVLHESFIINWSYAEKLAKQYVDELWIEADDIAMREQMETCDMFDTIRDAMRGCYV